MLHLATSVARPNLVSLGTCFGKFSKTGKFKLGITCLDYLAKYAKYKVRLFCFLITIHIPMPLLFICYSLSHSYYLLTETELRILVVGIRGWWGSGFGVEY